jgi:hypothetical protein
MLLVKVQLTPHENIAHPAMWQENKDKDNNMQIIFGVNLDKETNKFYSNFDEKDMAVAIAKAFFEDWTNQYNHGFIGENVYMSPLVLLIRPQALIAATPLFAFVENKPANDSRFSWSSECGRLNIQAAIVL